MTKAVDKNTKKYASAPRDEVRRTEYQVKDEGWIKELVKAGEFASIASIHDDQPFVTPMSYVYVEEEHALYFHGAKVGRLRANAEINPRVAVNVTEMGRMIPHPDANELSVEYKSVTMFGTLSRVAGNEEELMGLHALIEKYFAHLTIGVNLNPIPDHELKRVGVFKIEIESWTGKQLEKEADYPGAFFYPDFPGK